MINKDLEILKALFKENYSEKILKIDALAETGSYRRYYRIFTEAFNILGVINSDHRENEAYISFSKTFEDLNIDVPHIIYIAEDRLSYLVEDLGNTSLYQLASKNKGPKGNLTHTALDMYQKTLIALSKLQKKTLKHLDTSLCYPRDTFDYQSIIWDLYYFKYYTLKLLRVNYDEDQLEKELHHLAKDLDSIEREAFLYRDFQSRNVMIKNEKPYFIDFQGGRKGAIYYDIASLLYDANMKLHENDILHLSEYYYEKTIHNTISMTEYKLNLDKFAIIRLMQALGAFGLRGIIEKKPNFIPCIPYALAALSRLISSPKLKAIYPELNRNIAELKASSLLDSILKNDDL